MKNIIKYIKLFVIPFCAMAMLTISCDKINIKEKESPYLTYIRNIRIVNGGTHGDSVIYGKVDEDNKQITFPKLHKDTDLSMLRFEADLPAGATFDQETYDFTVDTASGQSQTVMRISVLNEKRYRVYDVTIRLSVPVFGADFAGATVYYQLTYPDLGSSAVTRSADMDDTHILFVSRADDGPHLLKISDVREGVIDPIPINTTGVSGGTFAYSSGCLAQGHIYMVNLAGVAGELSIYHWDSPSTAPTKIFAESPSTIDPILINRIGDDMSMHLDASGNGYIFLGNNANTVSASNKVLRIKVTGFTNLSEPTVLTMPVPAGYWSSYKLVDDSTDEYLYTGNAGGTYGMSLVGLAGNGIYTTPTADPLHRAGAAQVINYNSERYLALITGAGGSPSEVAIYVYDITRASTIKEALELLNPSTYKYKVNLGAGVAGTHPACLAFAKTADALFLFGAAPGAGFVLIEAPFATETDSFYDDEI